MTEESPKGDRLLPPPTHSTERGLSMGLSILPSLSQDGEGSISTGPQGADFTQAKPSCLTSIVGLGALITVRWAGPELQ